MLPFWVLFVLFSALSAVVSGRVSECYKVGLTSIRGPRGLVVKSSDSGAGGRRFESRRGAIVLGWVERERRGSCCRGGPAGETAEAQRLL